MKKFRKVAEIIMIPPNDTKKVLKTLENTEFSVLYLDNYSDGDHYILMEEENSKCQ